jgi:hypothetical protein
MLQDITVKMREKMHEDKLRNLSRLYALRILNRVIKNPVLAITSILNESVALQEQRHMKAQAGANCDIYPCEN